MSSKKNKQHTNHEKTVPTGALPITLTEEIGKKSTLEAVMEHYEAWLPKYHELAQGRSNFQIEKMIAAEHVTPAAAYQHTLYQLRVLHQSLLNDFIQGIEDIREFEYKWEEADRSKPLKWTTQRGGVKLCWYDIDKLKHEHSLKELKTSVKDKILQLETFTKVLLAMEDKHNGPYTQKELNAEEPEYWKLRLASQMSDQYLDRQTGLGTGNLKSLRMAMAQSPLPESKNMIEDFPDLLNATVAGPTEAFNVLNQINEELFKNMDHLGKKDLAKISNELERLKDIGIIPSDLDD